MISCRRVSNFRKVKWEPLLLVITSTPSRPIWIWGLSGVNSSSYASSALKGKKRILFKQLSMTYTCFCTNACVWRRYNRITKSDMRCALKSLNATRQMELLSYPWLTPGSKVSHLSVVSVIRKKHLRPDEQDLPVQANNSTIVSNISVLYGHL